MKKNSSFNTYKLTYLAILTALVVILQYLGNFIHFGQFSISLVLLPIVIGAAIGGAAGGAWLGAVFGAVVLLLGDAAFFMAINPVGTIITVMVKGVLCGFTAGLVYRALSARRYLAVISAAVVCPIVNTGIFLLGTRLFFWDAMVSGGTQEGLSAWGYVIFFMVGANFIFEFLFNLLLSPVLIRLIKLLPRSLEQ